MKLNRLTALWVLLVVLALVAGSYFVPSASEPTHAGKPLSAWFRELVFLTNAPATSNVMAVLNRGGQMVVLWNTPRGIVTTPLPGGTNRAIAPVFFPQSAPASKHAWEALKAIGPRAAPFLVAQMHYGRIERFYERNYTNVPILLRKWLPDPGERWLRRLRAIEAAERLGRTAHDTAPALLKLLREADPRLISPLPKALKSVGVERAEVAAVILQFGVQQNYAEVFRLTGEFGVNDPGVARLLGNILIGPQSKFHRDAIRTLESCGPRATPAIPAIVVALGSADPEVRYLAARSLENLARQVSPETRPELETLLRVASRDPSVIVSNVANRVLLELRTNAVPTRPGSPP